MNTNEAITESAAILELGAHVEIVKLCLVSDGFSYEKAETIIRWAKLKIKKDKS